MPISIISTTVSVPYNKINKKNIEKIITLHLKREFENKCCSYGFIKNNSVQIIQRSQGRIKSIDNISYIMYDINYKIDTYNPKKGDIISCKVNNNTKMGTIGFLYEKDKLLTLQNSPMLIIIPLSDSSKDLKPDDIIDVEVITSKLKYKSPQIQIIAKLEN